MKNILLSALALFTLAATAPTATAGRYSCPPPTYCAPVYVGTKAIGCRTECRWAVDHCGRRYAYEVTVTTYADYYSDGSRRTYTRARRA